MNKELLQIAINGIEKNGFMFMWNTIPIKESEDWKAIKQELDKLNKIRELYNNVKNYDGIYTQVKIDNFYYDIDKLFSEEK